MATQGSQANAKDDTLYYAVDGGGGFADLATDLSQYADNQTVAASWTYEAGPATRFNVTGTWSVEVDVDATNANTGRLMTYGTVAANSFISLRYGNSAGVVDVIMASGAVASVVGSLTLPGVSGISQNFVIAWAVQPNPYTTGASDALRHELRAWNVDTGEYAQSVFTSFVRTAGTAAFVWWALDTAGSSAFTGTPNRCRFSATRFKTATETREDFIATTSAPTITGQDAIEALVVDPNATPQQAGQMHAIWASLARSCRPNAMRTLSPLVNRNMLERTTLSGSTFSGMPSAWQRLAPNGADRLMGAFAAKVHPPEFCDRVKVRVHVQQWRTSGTTHDRIHLTMYALTRPPTSTGDVVDQATQLGARSVTDSIATSHGSGASAGAWVDLGLLPVVRNSQGDVWLVLALRLEDLSGAVANNRLRINAITVEPVVSANVP